VGNGTITGTVTSDGVTPIAGATVSLGNGRRTITNAGGIYTFTVPAGTYPAETATSGGRSTAAATNVVVPDGGLVTQNFTLAAAAASACLTDTTQADFQLGIPTNVDLATSSGDAALMNTPNADQSNTAGTTTGTGFGTPAWTAQTFTAGVTGTLIKADIQLFCNGCGATPPDLILSVRSTSAGLPTGADLTAATIAGANFGSGSTTTATGTFAAGLPITAGTQYALVLRPVSAPAGSGYFWIRSSPSTYAGGQRVLSADTGATWSSDSTRDYNFTTYVQVGYASSGDLVGPLKDANPGAGLNPTWTTLSWNASVPGNTTLKFQVAASNSQFGPFTYVGPDGTAGTFYSTSGGSIAQFSGKRYLRYRAFFTSTDPAATPTLNDVSVCYSNLAPTAATVAIGGRVTGADGGGIRGAVVTMTSRTGVQRAALTNAFGYYTFDSVQAGTNYVMRATARQYTFTSKVVNVADSLSNVDFVDGE